MRAEKNNLKLKNFIYSFFWYDGFKDFRKYFIFVFYKFTNTLSIFMNFLRKIIKHFLETLNNWNLVKINSMSFYNCIFFQFYNGFEEKNFFLKRIEEEIEPLKKN